MTARTGERINSAFQLWHHGKLVMQICDLIAEITETKDTLNSTAGESI